jgi:uncharacterized protein (UPF0335 family)
MSENRAGPSQVITSATAEKLAQLVSRIERLEEEKAEKAADIKEVYAEAKALGFDVKALRAIIRERKVDPEERATAYAIRDLYAEAIEASIGRLRAAVSAL